MPRDRVADELLLVDRLDVVALDHAEHRRELLQLLERQLRHRAARNGLQRHGGQRAGQGAEGKPAGDLEFMAHVERIQSSSSARKYTPAKRL